MNMGSGLHIPAQYKFTTDSGVPIGGGPNQNRSQTSVGGSRLNVNRANLSSFQNFASNGDVKANTVLPSTLPGMSIQNNIQNINLNINLAKG